MLVNRNKIDESNKAYLWVMEDSSDKAFSNLSSKGVACQLTF